MAVGAKVIPYPVILPEQVLTYFKIDIDDNNKCVCPFHNDTQASMQVNESYVYCYGCHWTGDVWKLAETLLNDPAINIGTWLKTTPFYSPTGRIYKQNTYVGSVPMNLVEYWHNCLLNNSEAYIKLMHDRMFHGGIIVDFKLGWRPDKSAYVIPYLYKDEAEIVQFRSTKTDDSGKKYWGLTNHNRGSIINRKILDTKQDYVVHMMGAFDPLLAVQDGLPSTGMNGSFPFRKDEKERVQEMFKKQDIIFIVPDNNPEEIKQAKKFAEWVGGLVRTFPEDLPHNTDYISYRKSGHSVEDFKRDVLKIVPGEDFSYDHHDRLCAMYDLGDVSLLGTLTGISYQDVAIQLVNYAKTAKERFNLFQVQTQQDLVSIIQDRYKQRGGW